jgi:hypothetical protein
LSADSTIELESAVPEMDGQHGAADDRVVKYVAEPLGCALLPS